MFSSMKNKNKIKPPIGDPDKRFGKTKILSAGIAVGLGTFDRDGANAVIRNEFGKIETIPIEGFHVDEDIELLVGSYITYEYGKSTDFEWKGKITSK